MSHRRGGRPARLARLLLGQDGRDEPVNLGPRRRLGAPTAPEHAPQPLGARMALARAGRARCSFGGRKVRPIPERGGTILARPRGQRSLDGPCRQSRPRGRPRPGALRRLGPQGRRRFGELAGGRSPPQLGRLHTALGVRDGRSQRMRDADDRAEEGASGDDRRSHTHRHAAGTEGRSADEAVVFVAHDGMRRCSLP